jgi:enoyl-CoA hydratase/carnithine racemase
MATSPEAKVLLVERKGPIALITLNRPTKYNALNIEINRALTDACKSLSGDVAVVVLRGAGKHFCAGSDLNDLYMVDRKEAERVLRLEMEAAHALLALSALTVAVVHGKCYGGGGILPLYCDLRIGRDGVEFALPEVSLGWVPPYGIGRLLANVPPAFALDVLLSGRVCHDREALDKGWLHRLAGTDDDLFPYLDKLAQIPRRTLADTLALSHPKNLPAIQKADEAALAAFLDHFDTDHARNKIASFVERKRS